MRFTTKWFTITVSSGFLWMIYQIIRNSGGNISIPKAKRSCYQQGRFAILTCVYYTLFM